MEHRPDVRVMKSYVWHEDTGKCFFVSTIDRTDSTPYEGRFAETMAWEYNWETSVRGNHILVQEGSCQGSIKKHIEVCEQLRANGKYEDVA